MQNRREPKSVKPTSYDPIYRSLSYTGGNVAIESGVYSDVVNRALRNSLHLDLQQLVHEDMKRDFYRYPQNWGLPRPDKNIDHRRVPNLQTYVKRQDYQFPRSTTSSHYQADDLVTCTVPESMTSLAYSYITAHAKAIWLE